MVIATRTRRIFPCPRCGGSVVAGECLLCGQIYSLWQLRGRMGGQETYRRYGREHYSVLGKLGGRPHLKTLKELIPSIASKNEVKGGELSRSLRQLRRLWKVQRERVN